MLFRQEMGVWIGAELVVGITLAAIWGLLLAGAFALALHTHYFAAHGPVDVFTDIVNHAWLLSFVFLCIAVVLSPLTSGLYAMAVKQVRGEAVQVRDAFLSLSLWLPVMGVTAILGVVMMVCSRLWYVPNMVVSGLTLLAIPLVVDRQAGPVAALRGSFMALRREWGMAIVVAFVMSMAAGSGCIALGIGMLFTAPLIFLGTAVIYRDAYLARQISLRPAVNSQDFDLESAR